MMVSSWSTHVKLTYPYYMENNKAFALINGGKISFFYCYTRFLLTSHKYKNNKKDLFIGIVKRGVAPLVLLGEELYGVVS
jgi:hypothetical protein